VCDGGDRAVRCDLQLSVFRQGVIPPLFIPDIQPVTVYGHNLFSRVQQRNGRNASVFFLQNKHGFTARDATVVPNRHNIICRSEFRRVVLTQILRCSIRPVGIAGRHRVFFLLWHGGVSCTAHFFFAGATRTDSQEKQRAHKDGKPSLHCIPP